jgi:hypothetical protein
MVELALMLPLILLILLFAIDFGRVFLGWVNLNNTVRIAANFAALNPNAWNPLNPDDVAKAEYIRQIEADAAGINCQMPTPIPDPVFPSGNAIGSPVRVDITCQFDFITPIIGGIVGDPMPVSASAAFPIRSGAINGIPVATTTVTTLTSTSTSSGSSTTTTTTSSSSTTAMCTVPDLRGLSTDAAQAAWSAALFTTNVIFQPLVPPSYIIDWQNPNDGLNRPCASTTITVKP